MQRQSWLTAILSLFLCFGLSTETWAQVNDGSQKDVVLVKVVDADSGRPVAHAVVKAGLLSADPSLEGLAWSLFRPSQIDQVLSDFTTNYATNEFGIAKIPRPASSFLLSARTDTHYSVPFAAETEPSEWVLRMVPAGPIKVLVQNKSGAPKAGVTVALASLTAPGYWVHHSATTNSEGMAEIEYLDAARGSGFETARVIPLGLIRKELGVEIRTSDFPRETLVFEYPETGDVKITVLDTAGNPAAGRHKVTLTSPRIPRHESGFMQDHSVTARPGFMEGQLNDGSIVFHDIPINLPLEVEVQSTDGTLSAHATFSGPEKSGDLVAQQLQVQSTFPILVGRILNQKGKAGRYQNFRAVLFHHEGPINTESLVTDEQGRFHYMLPKGVLQEGELELRLELDAKKTKPARSVTVPLPSPITAGMHDLGDLTLEIAPVLFTGIITDPSGDPIPDAYIFLHEQGDFFLIDIAYAQSARAYARARSDANGYFEMRGSPFQDGMAVTATAPGFQERETLLPPAAESLNIQLQPICTTQIQFLFDPEIDPSQLTWNGMNTEGKLHYRPRKIKHGSAEFTSVAQEPILFQLLSPQLEEVLFETKFTPSPDADGNFNAGTFDLRGKLRTVNIRFENPDGSKPGFVSFSRKGLKPTTVTQTGACRLITKTEALELEVLVLGAGGEPLHCTISENEQTIVLRPSIPVLIRISNQDVIPDHVSVLAMITPQNRGTSVAPPPLRWENFLNSRVPRQIAAAGNYHVEFKFKRAQLDLDQPPQLVAAPPPPPPPFPGPGPTKHLMVVAQIELPQTFTFTLSEEELERLASLVKEMKQH